MGPGHFGAALAAKAAAPKIPLLIYLIACEALDLLCFGLIAMGIETPGASQTSLAGGIQILTPGVIPWSHGLLMAWVWSALAGGAAWLVFRDRRSGLILGLVVFSHWALDFIVHVSDLPLLFAGSPKLGLGLWGSGPGLLISGILEIALIAGGLVIYLRWRKLSARKPALPGRGER